MIDDPKKSGIPPFLQTQNRVPLTPAQEARLDALLARPLPTVAESSLTDRDRAAMAELAAASLTTHEARKTDVVMRMGVRRARLEREGKFIPGARWDVNRGRWVHPALDQEGAVASQMKDCVEKYNQLVVRARERGLNFLPVKKFESVAVAERRIAALIEMMSQPQDSLQSTGPEVQTGPQSTSGHQPEQQEESVAKKTKKARTNGGLEAAKPAGLVADFHPVRAGTTRAKVVQSSGSTVGEIARKIGKDRRTVLAHLFCLNRDCAIGYEVNNDKVTLSFPGSKTLRDAIKERAAE